MQDCKTVVCINYVELSDVVSMVSFIMIKHGEVAKMSVNV